MHISYIKHAQFYKDLANYPSLSTAREHIPYSLIKRRMRALGISLTSPTKAMQELREKCYEYEFEYSFYRY